MDLRGLFRNSDDMLDFEAGQVVFQAGERGHHFYVVMAGQIEVRSEGRVLRTLHAGELFGEMALIDDAPRSATAIATTPARLAAIDERRFNFLVQQTPHFALVVMRTLAERLRHASGFAQGSVDAAG
jgi:CRP/FNR family transcriptional regulator, cyclic AMP receptor protein